MQRKIRVQGLFAACLLACLVITIIYTSLLMETLIENERYLVSEAKGKTSLHSLEFEKAEADFEAGPSQLVTSIRHDVDRTQSRFKFVLRLNVILVSLLVLLFPIFVLSIMRQYSEWNDEVALLNNQLNQRVEKQVMEITKQQAMLASQLKMASLGEMASGVSHEINNPLAIILGRAEQLLRLETSGKNDSSQNIKNLELIVKHSQRIAKIVSGLRLFSRSAENDPMVAIPIFQIVQDTLAFCGEKFKTFGIAIELMGDQEIELTCRPAQISQVLLNLVSNATDAISQLHEKWIKIECALDGIAEKSVLVLRVTDSGNGISPAIADKIMQPFFTTKELGKGTGLGLSISRGIVEAHEGKLELDLSSANTSFILRLPRACRKNQETAA